jgi:branched-chain amino acid aminotransferase
MTWIYLNDRFVPHEQAVVSVFDHGFLYGDGVFETLRASRGRILMLGEHLTRLERSASRLALELPLSLEQLADLIQASVERNHLQEAYIRVTVSRGAGEIGLDPALCKSPTLVIIAQPFVPHPESLYANGIGVAVVRTRRNFSEALPPEVKSLNFLNNILAKIEAIAAGADEAIMLNYRDELTEGTTSNIFVVNAGRLRTPAKACGLLDGVTRGIVLELAKDLAIPSDETVLGVADLYAAEECFLTNTTQEVLPVTKVDGRLVGDGRPGPVTARLRASYRSRLERLLEGP